MNLVGKDMNLVGKDMDLVGKDMNFVGKDMKDVIQFASTRCQEGSSTLTLFNVHIEKSSCY